MMHYRLQFLMISYHLEQSKLRNWGCDSLYANYRWMPGTKRFHKGFDDLAHNLFHRMYLIDPVIITHFKINPKVKQLYMASGIHIQFLHYTLPFHY